MPTSEPPLDPDALTVMCVAGARPNFPKLKPVIDRPGIAAACARVLVHTGQHYDDRDERRVLRRARHPTAGPHPRGRLRQSTPPRPRRIMTAFEPLVDDAAARRGRGRRRRELDRRLRARRGQGRCRVAHVEAGLRSRDWAMPEEINRVVTDRLSDYLFAPSADAVDNLRARATASDQVHLVGNVMIDTLLANLRPGRRRGDVRARARSRRRARTRLATLHRPSNVDDDRQLGRLVGAVGSRRRALPVVFPAHPRTAGRLRRSNCRSPAASALIEPLGYLDFLALQAPPRVVLTDSGGVQEETTALGVPCLTLRENTERPITVTEGTNQRRGRRSRRHRRGRVPRARPRRRGSPPGTLGRTRRRTHRRHDRRRRPRLRPPSTDGKMRWPPEAPRRRRDVIVTHNMPTSSRTSSTRFPGILGSADPRTSMSSTTDRPTHLFDVVEGRPTARSSDRPTPAMPVASTSVHERQSIRTRSSS